MKMKPLKKITLNAAMGLSMLGCSSVKVGDYAQEKPALQLESYFDRTVDAYGIFQDRSGRVTKRFHCVITPANKDGVLTLNEQFTYSDGSKSERIWTIHKTSATTYVGKAGDVVGEAKGEVAGNALRWQYVLDLEVDGSHYKVDFDDWMYLMSDQVMLNRSAMSKFGVHLGQVTLTFVKRPS